MKVKGSLAAALLGTLFGCTSTVSTAPDIEEKQATNGCLGVEKVFGIVRTGATVAGNEVDNLFCEDSRTLSFALLDAQALAKAWLSTEASELKVNAVDDNGKCTLAVRHSGFGTVHAGVTGVSATLRVETCPSDSPEEVVAPEPATAQ